ncbi:MAG: MucB/RseB C-terminal domain-containing protein [Gammaproteobacteria bacterium]|nr:MucB/RseB C-terminal domain-containing protein [Gammaproteobacteria bacterium]
MNLTRFSVLCLCIFTGQLFAAEGLSLLDRMSDSMRSSNYTGTFVYRHKEKVETLKIIHRQTENGIDERLITLTGKPREIIRDDKKVTCIWPEKRLVLLDKNRRRSRFPGIVPENLNRLPDHYSITLNDKYERVAGRSSYVVDISPKDMYRYGYRIWIDRDSHLLIGSDLLDEKNRAVEQVMFTELKVYKSLPDDLFESEYLQEGYHWQEVDKAEDTDEGQVNNWQAGMLPPGFSLQTYNHKKKSKLSGQIEHMVYSDGMASVSVFVEAVPDGKDEKLLIGNRRRGALSIYGKSLDNYHVTVLGEVPESTVKLIAESIQHK